MKQQQKDPARNRVHSLAIRLDDEEAKAVWDEASRRRVTRSDVVRGLILEHLMRK